MDVLFMWRIWKLQILGMVQNVVTLFSTQQIVVFSITLDTTSSYEYFWPSNYPEKCYPWGYELNHAKYCNICGRLYSGEPNPGNRCDDCWNELMSKD
jgi:hypothetical protein